MYPQVISQMLVICDYVVVKYFCTSSMQLIYVTWKAV